jgi:hypothetical protein
MHYELLRMGDDGNAGKGGRDHTTIKHSKWERGQKDGGRDTGDAMNEKRAQMVRIIRATEGVRAYP